MYTSITRLSHVDPVVILDLGPEGLGLGLRQAVNSAEDLALLVVADINLQCRCKASEQVRVS